MTKTYKYQVYILSKLRKSQKTVKTYLNGHKWFGNVLDLCICLSMSFFDLFCVFMFCLQRTLHRGKSTKWCASNISTKYWCQFNFELARRTWRALEIHLQSHPPGADLSLTAYRKSEFHLHPPEVIASRRFPGMNSVFLSVSSSSSGSRSSSFISSASAIWSISGSSQAERSMTEASSSGSTRTDSLWREPSSLKAGSSWLSSCTKQPSKNSSASSGEISSKPKAFSGSRWQSFRYFDSSSFSVNPDAKETSFKAPSNARSQLFLNLSQLSSVHILHKAVLQNDKYQRIAYNKPGHSWINTSQV